MALSMADGHNTERALNALDFYVAVDPYLNETTRFADVIIPPCGPLEKSHYDMFYHLYDTINWTKYAPPLFVTEHSKWSDFEIFTELMGRFAYQRAQNPVKKFLVACAHKLASRFIKPETVLGIGLRFGPYGKGLNPFDKEGLTLQKLKDKPHGIFL